MTTKRCPKCGEVKARSEFFKNRCKPDGLQSRCKVCADEYTRQWEAKPGNKAKRREYMRKVDRKRAGTLKRKAQWREADRKRAGTPKRKAQKREAYYRLKENSEGLAARLARQCAYRRKRRATDPLFAFADNMRRRINSALRGHVKSTRTPTLLGVPSIEFYMNYLSTQLEPGMTWANYGEWHVDHVEPLSARDLSDPANQRALFHFTNTRPMWGAENLARGNRFEWSDLLTFDPFRYVPDDAHEWRLKVYGVGEFDPIAAWGSSEAGKRPEGVKPPRVRQIVAVVAQAAL